MTTGVLNHKITRRGFLKTSAALGAVAALGDRLFGGPLSTLMVGAQVEGVVSDKWVSSTCNMCRGGRDLIRGHVVNGVLVTVEGNKMLEGKVPSPSLCCVKPRGLVQWAYNPYRIKGPMKRTNPKKGLNEDPGFVEISWDEALDTLADKLKEIRDSAQGLKNEHGWNRVAYGSFCCGKSIPVWGNFWGTFGSTESDGSWPNVCYGNQHYFASNWHLQYATAGDADYANWFLAIGKNKIGATTMGFGASGIIEMADYAVRGGKLIYLSPYQGITGAKADEWLPIKHATDAAFFYAMINVILNEMDWRQVADLDFLKKMSASPYLVGPKGYWVRDPATKKPMVWDSVAGAAKVEDDPTIGDFALDGGPYTVNGVEVDFNEEETAVTQGTPSFQLMLDHFKTNTPEWAAPITDIPAKTIRRIAHEFVEHSMVGATIKIDGYTYSYRPATMHLGKHVTSGLGCYSLAWAEALLYMLMGSMHAPGGMGIPGMPHSKIEATWVKDDRVDGFPPSKSYPSKYGNSGKYISGNFSWPMTSRTPSALTLKGSATTLKHRILMGEAVHDIPGSLPDLMVSYGWNKVAGSADSNITRSGLEKIPFFAPLAVEINETNWYADLLLPDAMWMIEDWGYQGATSAATQIFNSKNNFFAPNQPMIKSPVNARDATDILTDLAEKMGPEFLAEYNQKAMGSSFEGDLTKKYTVEEIMDRKLLNYSGVPAEMKGLYGVEYYKENSAITWPVTKLQLNFYREMRRTGTRYELPYLEGYKKASLKRLVELHGVGINWRDEAIGLLTHGLLPIEDARGIYEEVYEAGPGSEYDVWLGHHRVHQFGFGRNKGMPWNIEVTDFESRGIVINPETAAKKGLANGDWVALEDRFGNKNTGRLIVSPTIRPDAVETADFGHYQTPIARGQAVPSSAEIESAEPRLLGAMGDISCSHSILKIYKTEEIIPNKPTV